MKLVATSVFLPENDISSSCRIEANVNFAGNYVYGEAGLQYFKYDLVNESPVAAVDFEDVSEDFLVAERRLITPDRVIVRAFERATSNTVYLEGNLNDGTIKNLGTLKDGNREVTNFVALEPAG